jgi:hypothetical protein
MQAGQLGLVVRLPLPHLEFPRPQVKNNSSPVALVDGCASCESGLATQTISCRSGRANNESRDGLLDA